MRFASFRMLRRAIVVYLLITIIGTPWSIIQAQSGPTGTLSGVVSDQSGA